MIRVRFADLVSELNLKFEFGLVHGPKPVDGKSEFEIRIDQVLAVDRGF